MAVFENEETMFIIILQQKYYVTNSYCGEKFFLTKLVEFPP